MGQKASFAEKHGKDSLKNKTFAERVGKHEMPQKPKKKEETSFEKRHPKEDKDKRLEKKTLVKQVEESKKDIESGKD